LPRTNGEAAFAASNTNIVIKGNNTWIVGGRNESEVSILQIKEYLGSIRYANCTRESDDWHFTADFMTLKEDLSQATMKLNSEFSNKARTSDGGKTWDLMAENQGFGYASCIQYIPNSEEIVS
jgi:hypothetical protein